MFPPALPELLANTNDSASSSSLRGGCWLITYVASGLTYDGTFRVVPTASAGSTISGDLYLRSSQPDPTHGIPILPRAMHKYYLRVTTLDNRATNAFLLTLEMWEYGAASKNWHLGKTISFSMSQPDSPPSPYRKPDYAYGNSGRPDSNSLTMGWISPNYRKAQIQIDTAPGCKVPQNNGGDENWASVFGRVGWELTPSSKNRSVTLAAVRDNTWTDAQLHEAMLLQREKVNLDQVWQFYMLSVNKLYSTDRGIMFDVGAVDSNSTPREGVAIANDWVFTQDIWGDERGKRFADSDKSFFRTAVHEVGHAMGLNHDSTGNMLMNTSDVIAGNDALNSQKHWPKGIDWHFAGRGLRGLRHFPDPFVRPGGLYAAEPSYTNPLIAGSNTNQTLSDLELKVTPLLSEVPLGAPVRVLVELTNSGNSNLLVPADISLKSEYVRGQVQKLDGGIRTFKPLIVCMDETPALKELEPGDSIGSSLTLLRGGQGALFHDSGLFEVTVTLRWPLTRDVFAIQGGSSTVFVLPPENTAQAKAAHAILTEPDTHLVMVMGQAGENHLKEGAAAIETAAKDKVLGNHYASIEARRLLQLGHREYTSRALKLIDGEKIVCSSPERIKLHRLVEKAQDYEILLEE